MLTKNYVVLRVFIIAILLGFFLKSSYSQIQEGSIPGAPKDAVVKKSQFSTGIQKTAVKQTNAKGKQIFATTTFTFNDIVTFATFDSTEITIYNQSNDTIDHFVINNDEYRVASTGQGIFRVEGTKSFSLITGDPVANSVVGFFAVNENGYPLSTKHQTYMPTHEWEGEHFIIFAYQENTEYELRNLETGNLISAGVLDEGEHYVYDKNDVFLGVTSNKPVSALTYTDQGYYYPASNGTFKGELFYGFSGNIGGWENGVIATAYEDNTPILVKDSETQDTLGTDTLQQGEVYSRGINQDRYITVESGKPVTVANTPYAGWSSGYAYLTRHIGNHGFGISNKFYVPTISGRFDVFSYVDSNAVTITNSYNDTVWNDTLHNSEGYSFNSDKEVYKVESSGKVSVITSNSGSWGADFMPMNYATNLPDLSISSADISFAPDSVGADDTVNISATVHNTSNVDIEDVFVQFYDGHPDKGGIPIGQKQMIQAIDSSSSESVSLDWEAPENPAIHFIYTVVDGEDNIVESNESNNMADRPLHPNQDLAPPLSITTDVPFGIEVIDNKLHKKTFVIKANIFNNSEAEAINVVAQLNELPAGLELLETSDSASQELGDIPPTGSMQVKWTVRATEKASGTIPYSMLFTADNTEDKTVERGLNLPYTADFRVDLSTLLDSAGKAFNPGKDTLYLSGSWENWPKPGSVDAYKMTDPDGDSIYSLPVYLNQGTHKYKYYYVPAGNSSSWEYAEWDSKNNRTLKMTAQDTSFKNFWGGYRIKFYITDGDNAQVNASVTIAGKELSTGSEGYAATVLPDGKYEYTVSKSGFDPVTDSIKVDGNAMNKRITLQKSEYMVTFDISGGGDPLEDATVSINGTDLNTDGSGEAEISLTNGEYEYTVSADGYKDTTGNVMLSGSDTTLSIVLETVTGVGDIVAESTIRVYPNPAKEEIIIQYEKMQTVKVINMQGSVISEKNVSSPKIRYRVDKFDAGIYILKVINQEGITRYQRLIIQK